MRLAQLAQPSSGTCTLQCREHRARDLKVLAQCQSHQLGVAIADTATYWPAADVHVRCFYHQTQKKSSGNSKNQHAMFRGLFDRVDRAIALQASVTYAGGADQW